MMYKLNLQPSLAEILWVAGGLVGITSCSPSVTFPSLEIDMSKFIAILGISVVCLIDQATAQQRPISGEFQRRLPSGSTLLAVGSNGRAATAVVTGKKFRVAPPTASARLYVLNDNKIAAQIVLSRCKKKRGTQAINTKSCNSQEVFTSFKAGKKLGAVAKIGSAYVLRSASLGNVIPSDKASSTRFVPIGVATLGLGGVATTQGAFSALAESGSDADKDGLVDALDIDDNGNGIIDNYDPSSPAPSSSDSFRVFSNLKLDLAQSLNLHATGALTSAAIDAALQSVQTLAIQVAGNTSETTELDCGSLSYCSAGGTGQSNNQPFPGSAGGAFDSDSDGLGTITRGSTGDFQLQTKATSSAIGAGDTMIQRVTATDGSARQIPGVLNFVFNSTPALKTISVNGDPEQTINYATTPRLGSRQNCIQAPASGDVTLAITGWRPQRPGVAAAGEGQFVDIGKSLITIDIPNAPVPVGSSSPGASGPGNCVSTAYSVPSDANLTVTTNGLQDAKADTEAVSSNTYSFTVNISSCLNSAPSGSISWPANTELYIDLQFRSRDGDNAAQKFCVVRLPV